jgi:hypothetical protein
MQGTSLTGQTNALEMVFEKPRPLSVMPSLVVPTFYNTISNTGPQYSTTMNILASKTIILDIVSESYGLAQAKIAPYLNKMNLENPEPQQPNNPNWAETNKFKKDLDNVVKTIIGVDIGNTILNQNPYEAYFDKFTFPRGWCMLDLINLVVMMTEPHGNTLVLIMLLKFVYFVYH